MSNERETDPATLLIEVAAYADRCVALDGEMVNRGLVGSELRVILAGLTPRLASTAKAEEQR